MMVFKYLTESIDELVANLSPIVQAVADSGRVIDESPAAYKSIDAVMEAQRSLVDVVHTLRQVVNVKG